jgi:hypothetical protein
VISDEGNGANWARNRGFEKVNTEYVLFSDNDINWRKNAVYDLLEVLEEDPKASYSYGAYMLGDEIRCNQFYDAELLKRANFASTMSLIRTKDFPGFDETLKRFQDWDLWLTMAEQGKYGVHCGEIIFDTPLRDGITRHGPDLKESWEILKDKHKL